MAETPKAMLRRWLQEKAAPEAAAWAIPALDALAASRAERDLHIFLGMAPRRLGRGALALSAAEIAASDAARPGWAPARWSLDGAARVLALLTFRAADRGPGAFADTFRDLRRTADAAELIALYRGFPLYPEPETLEPEAGEALRSNLTPVFEAIAHHNPYPRDHFAEHRWNHMILKAVFVGSALAPIQGLRARANPELARMLADYARERWAAGRAVAADLWIPVLPFRDDPAVAAVLARAVATGELTQEALT